MPRLQQILRDLYDVHDLMQPEERARVELLACAGRLDGELIMRAYDEATWQVPLFYGSLKARDGAFHIWDATDDFSAVNMDLQFSGDRLHLHNTQGTFGAVPMTIHGAAVRHLACVHLSESQKASWILQQAHLGRHE